MILDAVRGGFFARKNLPKNQASNLLPNVKNEEYPEFFFKEQN